MPRTLRTLRSLTGRCSLGILRFSRLHIGDHGFGVDLKPVRDRLGTIGDLVSESDPSRGLPDIPNCKHDRG